MARFYARFDGGVHAQLDASFEQLRIAGSSASAAPLRDGLFASRSAVSADVYDDLDVSNRLWSNGTYFPPDQQTFPSATLTSWSTAYSSSVPGIQAYNASNNTYGGTSEVNYSLRPTASVTSTMNTLVGPESPLDPVQLNYNVYLSASNAVKTVLDTAQYSNATPATPYTRVGLNPSRTLHSIWHDPTMSYFAWDDFTPGTPQNFGYSIGNTLQTVQIPNAGTTYTNMLLFEAADVLRLTGSVTGQYKTDAIGTASLTASLRLASNGLSAFDTQSRVVGLELTSWNWAGLAGLGFPANIDGLSYHFDQTASFSDPIIPAHTGSTAAFINSDVVRILGVNAASLRYATTQNGLCGTNGTTATFYLTNGATQPGTPDVYAFSSKNPATFALGGRYYVLASETISNGNTIYEIVNQGEAFQTATATCP